MSATAIIFQISLVVAALLCTTVFGLVLVFVAVVMPGIAELDDGAFLRAFQLMDGIIQRNEPIFTTVWVGSILSLIVAAFSGFCELNGAKLAFMMTATAAFIVAQVTTFAINVPLNNRVQTLNIHHMDAMAKTIERDRFESKWNCWNTFRTVIFGCVSTYLLILLLLTDSEL